VKNKAPRHEESGGELVYKFLFCVELQRLFDVVTQGGFLRPGEIFDFYVPGYFTNASEDIVHFGIRYLVLSAVYKVLDGIPFLGPYLTGIFGAVFAFLDPVVLTVLIVWFDKKYFMGKK
jgi:hypothetical protein